MKFTVYVEGQSEMLFVADVLQKYSNYDPEECGFYCINLVADIYDKVPYPSQGSIESKNFYQIINTNNDTLVNTRLRKDSTRLKENGYDIIIGLRDAYGEEYQRLMANARVVDIERIAFLHSIQTNAINTKDIDCRLHFAIMEFETWILALIENYINRKGYDPIETFDKYNIIDDLENIYHPYPLVQKIFELCDDSYHKHKSDTYTFLSTLSVDDYENLRTSGRCPSFTKFIDSLFGAPCPSLP